MAYSCKNDTRHWTIWVSAIVLNLLGWPIVFAFGLSIYMDGYQSGPVFALCIGILFLIGGCLFIYKIIYPTTYEGIVTNKNIVCKKNGEITHDVNRDNIDNISLSQGDWDLMYINLKNNNRIRIGACFVTDFDAFKNELELLGYQIIE